MGGSLAHAQEKSEACDGLSRTQPCRTSWPRLTTASIHCVLGIVGILVVTTSGLVNPACELCTELTVFWSCLGVFGIIYITLLALIYFAEHFAQYPRQDAIAATVCIDRSCALGLWLWIDFGCITYIRTVSKPACWISDAVTFNYWIVIVLGVCVIFTPVLVYSLDLATRRARSGARDVDLELTYCERNRIYRDLPNSVVAPPGFRCGVASMAGSNCWISSLVQLLRGTPANGPVHDMECMKIRKIGVAAGAWPSSPIDIEATSEAVEMVCSAIDHQPVPNVVVFAGSHATLRQDIMSSPDAPTVHMFNPHGQHYDPLWPVS